MAQWEVFALRYARHDKRTAHENFLVPADPHDTTPLDYYVWLLRRDNRVIVVDTGFGPEQAAKRGRQLLMPVDALLREFGVEPAQVEDVVITHLHYDHAGNLNLFPKARFHLQDKEMSYATGRHMRHACISAPFEVEDVVTMVRAVYADRVSFHDGDVQIADGVSLHRVGGHTDGLQMVRVATQRGMVVLMSDGSHLYENMQLGRPFPIFIDLGGMTDGWRRALELADSPDHLIPGHDPKVREIYPVEPGCGGHVVALHIAPTYS